MKFLCFVLLSVTIVSALHQAPLDNFSVKCCPVGLYLDNSNSKCVYANGTASDTHIHRPQCFHGMYLVNPNENQEDFFEENSDGDLVLQELEGDFSAVSNGTWCAANILPEHGSLTTALVCFEDENEEYSTGVMHDVYGICILISVVFFIFTLAVYVLLPELRDVQGLCLMANIFSLILGYFMLAIVQLFGSVISDASCIFSAFFLYYWLLSAFFWLSVVSFNVWRNLVPSRSCMVSGRTKFACYTCYAWGTPAVFLLLVICAHYAPEDFSSLYKPRFGVSSCWFHGPEETWLYFYGPISIIICANIYFFTTSALQVWRTEDTNNGTQIKSKKFKWVLYLKLFVVMGITWIFEVASFAEGSKTWFWYITDVLNCLQGIFFFLILVCRQRVLRLICMRPWGYKMFGDRFQGTPEELESDDEDDDNAEVVELANPSNK